MKHDGWTIQDLAGELWARGINIEQVAQVHIESSLAYRFPEEAAEFIANDLNG